MKQGMPSLRGVKTFRPRRPKRRGLRAMTYRIGQIIRSVFDQPFRSLSIAVSVAVGVGIAITIIAASDGINTKINALLDTHGTVSLATVGIDVHAIHTVLIQTRDLLTDLAIGFTAALVGLVTWVTIRQRRREIGIKLMNGEYLSEVLTELLGESLLLCLLGGGLGVGLGLLLCKVISQQLPLLPMSPSLNGIMDIFPWTTFLSFIATAIIALIYIVRPDTSEGL